MVINPHIIDKTVEKVGIAIDIGISAYIRIKRVQNSWNRTIAFTVFSVRYVSFSAAIVRSRMDNFVDE